MLSKARVKYIKSLQLKKYRLEEQRFTVEGEKSVLELLQSDFSTETLIGTLDFFDRQSGRLKHFTGERLQVSEKVLADLGFYQSNKAVMAVARMKPNSKPDILKGEFVLMLDDIRDPGNLGTIIRIADWYGINKIIASRETADFYNPKVLQASMGSFTRITIYYTDLIPYVKETTIPVFGTFLDGESVHTMTWGNEGILLIGNEAHGISSSLEEMVTRKITIPRFGQAESLNAAVATAIICDNLRRP
jgi:TrmH family RNA methyltransferase